MKKAGKKLIALLVIFTSIISFLPVEFGGQLANAATSSANSVTSAQLTQAQTIHLYSDNEVNLSEISLTTDSTTKEQYYSCNYDSNTAGSTFLLGVQNLSTTASQVEIDAEAAMKSATQVGPGSVTEITGQEVVITGINDITFSDADTDTVKNQKLSQFGIAFQSYTGSGTIGKKIVGMPLGVDKIQYKVIVTTTTYNYMITLGADGKTLVPQLVGGAIETPNISNETKMTIYFGANYLSKTVQSMIFKAYAGDSTAFDSNDEIPSSDTKNFENNTTPFLYINKSTQADKNMPLKFTYDVPWSITKLMYILDLPFANSNGGNNTATIYKNGKPASVQVSAAGNNTTEIQGNLETAGTEDLILINLSNSTGNIGKTFCVEINYNYPDASTDYTLADAGITKLEYANDDSVKAYIGKTFTITKETNNTYNTYTGSIAVDPKAEEISIDPTLAADAGKSSDSRTLAYKVSNHYYDPISKSSKIAQSILKNGKQYVYIDYDSGADNKIYVEVYAGENGSPTSSTILARYILNVTVNTSQSQFNMGLTFDGNSSTDSTYLTQPGVTKADNGEVSFSTSRRTYDLYTTDPNKVKVTLSGQTSNNEYLKIWLAKGTQSNALYNAPISQSGDDYDVTLDSGAKKMVVQAYYNSTTGAAASYAVGDAYVFYLPEHYDGSDTSPGDGGSSSADASLSDLEVKGITLKDSDGKSGFSSTQYDYTATVDKGATTAKITATAADSNVKSIVATVKDTNESDDLTSGEESEIALDTDGKTTVNIVVTAQDGITTRTYTLIIQNNIKSNNADLENVILNTGDYKFDPSESTTTVRVSQGTTSITVTPVPKDPNATATVNGDEVADGPITVNLRGSQKTEIEIVVTSQDGTETKTYTLEVYRTDSTSWQGNGDDSSYDDQYYDEYYNCWVDTTKYDEWGTVKGNPVYFDKNHRQVKDAWITTGGKYYYLNSSGYRSSGWKVDSATGQSYYLDPTTGEMKLGWINLNNTWYYLGLNGVMHKGWLYLNGKWYYFTPNGQMVVNQTMFVDDKNYTFGQDGTVIA